MLEPLIDGLEGKDWVIQTLVCQQWAFMKWSVFEQEWKDDITRAVFMNWTTLCEKRDLNNYTN